MTARIIRAAARWVAAIGGATVFVVPVVFVVFVVLVGFVGGTVIAHSGLGAASPAPGSTVGGEITDVQLRYSSAVSDVTGSITDPNGAVLDTEVVQDSVLAISIRLAQPLSLPGEYTVGHSSLSVQDGDRVDATYRFTYEPTAPPPQLLPIADDEGTELWGISIRAWIALGAGVAVITVLAWRLAGSLKRARQGASSPPDG